MSQTTVKSSYISSLWIAGISFVLLLAADVSWLGTNPQFKLPPRSDSESQTIEAIGWGLYSGLGFATHFDDPQWRAAYLESDPNLRESWSAKTGPVVPRTDHAPLLPTVIAGMYRMFGVNQTAFAAVRVFLGFCLAVSSAISIFLAHRYAQWVMQHRSFDHCSNRTKQILALFCVMVCFAALAFFNHARIYSQDFVPELPALALTQLLVVVGLVALRRTGMWVYVAVGLVLGFMIYTWTFSVVWVPGLFILMFALGRYSTEDLQTMSLLGNRWVKRFLRALCPIVVAAVVIAPWCLRNSLTLHQFKPFGNAAPIALLGGYCDEAYEQDGNWSHQPEAYWRGILKQSFGDELVSSSEASLLLELELAAIARREVWQWITANKTKLPSLALKRLYSLYSSQYGLNNVLLLVALFGGVVSIRYIPRESLFLLGLWLTSTAAVMATYNFEDRSLIPMYGVLCLCGALGCTLVAAWCARLIVSRRD